MDTVPVVDRGLCGGDRGIKQYEYFSKSFEADVVFVYACHHSLHLLVTFSLERKSNQKVQSLSRL